MRYTSSNTSSVYLRYTEKVYSREGIQVNSWGGILVPKVRCGSPSKLHSIDTSPVPAVVLADALRLCSQMLTCCVLRRRGRMAAPRPRHCAAAASWTLSSRIQAYQFANTCVWVSIGSYYLGIPHTRVCLPIGTGIHAYATSQAYTRMRADIGTYVPDGHVNTSVWVAMCT
jgi:hypothetical protein